MERWAVLLRGINVGGKHRVAMARLREVVAELGHQEVSTYIQSGNVLLRSASVDREALEEALAAAFGFPIPVVVRSAGELQAIVAGNPYAAEDPAKVAVTMLRDPPALDAVAKLDPARSAPDVFTVVGRDVYLHCPNGFAETKLSVDWFKRHLGTDGTTRNWRTTCTLAERLAAPG